MVPAPQGRRRDRRSLSKPIYARGAERNHYKYTLFKEVRQPDALFHCTALNKECIILLWARIARRAALAENLKGVER